VGVLQIGANAETVGDTAEQVDLPGLASLDEGLLRLVAELGGEDRVDLCMNLLENEFEFRLSNSFELGH
jgi:hypothetical protein